MFCSIFYDMFIIVGKGKLNINNTLIMAKRFLQGQCRIAAYWTTSPVAAKPIIIEIKTPEIAPPCDRTPHFRRPYPISCQKSFQFMYYSRHPAVLFIGRRSRSNFSFYVSNDSHSNQDVWLSISKRTLLNNAPCLRYII